MRNTKYEEIDWETGDPDQTFASDMRKIIDEIERDARTVYVRNVRALIGAFVLIVAALLIVVVMCTVNGVAL